MRVLLGPRAEIDAGCLDVADRLAGSEGLLVRLSSMGVRVLDRRLSPAEVEGARRALLGLEKKAVLGPRPSGDRLVGYVCRGRSVGAGKRVVAVEDHINLTWRSPLTGSNDDALGPRFPAMAGVYRPDCVMRGLDACRGVVAEVLDDSKPTPFENDAVASSGCVAVTSELAAIVILAAHLGYRVAAALVVT